MEIKPGTLVVCSIDDIDGKRNDGAFGLVISERLENDMPWQKGRSFETKLIYPPSFGGITISFPEQYLLPLAQIGRDKIDFQVNLPEIILSLVREIDSLKRQVQFLQETQKAL